MIPLRYPVQSTSLLELEFNSVETIFHVALFNATCNIILLPTKIHKKRILKKIELRKWKLSWLKVKLYLESSTGWAKKWFLFCQKVWFPAPWTNFYWNGSFLDVARRIRVVRKCHIFLSSGVQLYCCKTSFALWSCFDLVIS